MASLDFSPSFLMEQAFQSFTVTSGPSSTAGAVTTGMSLFNAATSTKYLYIYSVRFFGGNASTLHQTTTGTSLLALANTATPVSNLLQSGLTSVATCKWQTVATTVSGTVLDAYAAGNGTQFNQAPGPYGDGYIVPPGASFNLFVSTNGAGPCAMTIKYREWVPTV